MKTIAEDKDVLGEKRSSRRMGFSAGVSAFFKNNMRSVETVFVRNISEYGMLVCDPCQKVKYDIGASIRDIIVSISPAKKTNAGIGIDVKTCFLISHGRIVRHFFDHTSNTSCYGILFLGQNQYLRREIKNLMNLQ